MTCTHRWGLDNRPYSPISGIDTWIAIYRPVQCELSYNKWGGVQSTSDADTEVLLASLAGPECLRSKGISVLIVLRPRLSGGDGSIGGLSCPCINIVSRKSSPLPFASSSHAPMLSWNSGILQLM